MADIADLSDVKRRLLLKYLRGEVEPSGGIGVRPQREFPPLSLAQERMWRLNQRPGIPPLYNEVFTVRRQGPLDIAILQRCLAEIVSRHEVWRTSYDVIDGRPYQLIHAAPAEFSLRSDDLRGQSATRAEQEIARLAADLARQPFDLRHGPLLRAQIVRTGDEDYRLLITAHLSVVDGVSVYDVLPCELSQLYEAFGDGRESPLPDPAIQYADYAWWQRQRRREADLDRAYWRQKLTGAWAPLEWPRRRPPVQTFRGAIKPFTLRDEATAAALRLSRQEGVTLFACLEAAFVAVLRAYTAQRHIAIGTFSSPGRKRSEVRGLLGHFLNPVVLLFQMHDGVSFADLVRQAQQVTSEAISHDNVLVEDIAREMAFSDDPSRHPLFTVAISVQPRTPDLDGWSVTSMDASSGGAFWDLYLAFIEQPSAIIGRAQYNPDLLDDATITHCIEDLQRVLCRAAHDPGAALDTTAAGLRERQVA